MRGSVQSPEEKVSLPLAKFDHHFMDQIEFKGHYRSKPLPASASSSQLHEIAAPSDDAKRTMLYLSVSIDDIMSIDIKNESFTVRFHYTLLWEADTEDLQARNLQHLLDKALEAGHHYTLTSEEVLDFHQKTSIPSFEIENRMSPAEIEGTNFYRIYGGKPNATAILLGGVSCTVTCRQKFYLKDFPFDLQELKIIFRLDTFSARKNFHLVTSTVQFSKQSIEFTEWLASSPVVRSGGLKYAVTQVCLQMERRPEYFINNVWTMLTLLAALGLILFMLEASSQGERIVYVVTVMLTAFAYKFSINSDLPAVPYSTLMDHYISASVYNLALMTFLGMFPGYYVEDHPAFAFNLNLALGLFCALILITSCVAWFAMAASLRASRASTTQRIELTQKHWYSFHFIKADFLPAVLKESEFKLQRRRPSSGYPIGRFSTSSNGDEQRV